MPTTRTIRTVMIAMLMVAAATAVRVARAASIVIDDFSASQWPAIPCDSADYVSDAGIFGGERDILIDCRTGDSSAGVTGGSLIGYSQYDGFWVIQYDGDDTDPSFNYNNDWDLTDGGTNTEFAFDVSAVTAPHVLQIFVTDTSLHGDIHNVPVNAAGTHTVSFSAFVDAGTPIDFGHIRAIAVYGFAPSGSSTITIDEFRAQGAPGTLEFSAASDSVNEDGTGGTLTVTRTGGSIGAVSVDITFTGGTATGGTPPLTFPEDYDSNTITLSWADGDTTAQSVTFEVLDDTVVEGNETVDMQLGNATGGASIGAQSTATRTIVDNDGSAGVLQFSAATDSVNEDGTGGTLTVTRAGGSAGAVSVDITFTGGSATGGTLPLAYPEDYSNTTITLSWGGGISTAQSVSFTINDDAVDEADETAAMQLANATGGAVIGVQNTATRTIIDDDTAGITVNPVGLAVSEPSGSAQFTISLQSEPTDPVTIDLSSDDTTECQPAVASVTLNAGNWSSGVDVTVNAVDDAMTDGPQTCAIITDPASSPDGNYNGTDPADVTVTVNDNETAGVTINPTAFNLVVGGAARTYTIVLTTQPAAPVTITAAAGGVGCTVAPAGATFNPSSAPMWNVPQTFTVTSTGVAGDVCTIAHTAAGDPPYVALNPLDDVVVTLINPPPIPVGDGGRGGGGGPAAFDPALSKRGEPENAAPGETVIWTLTIWNPHSGALSGVIVNDPVPGMFDIVDVDTPIGTAAVDGQIVTITIPSLAPGQSFDATITTVANDLATPGEVCNTVYSGAASAEGCIAMYPGMLPETGGTGMAIWWAAGAAALAGAGVGGYVLIRRRGAQAG